MPRYLCNFFYGLSMYQPETLGFAFFGEISLRQVDKAFLNYLWHFLFETLEDFSHGSLKNHQIL